MLCSRISYLIADSRPARECELVYQKWTRNREEKETRDAMHVPSHIVVVVLCMRDHVLLGCRSALG